MATINDIAKMTGYSKSTVSYVLSKKKKMSQETITRVMNACQALNYHPNALATSLATKKTNVIGVFLGLDEHNKIDSYLHKIYGDFLIGVSLNAIIYGYKPLVCIDVSSKDALNSFLLSGSEPIDAAIVLAPHTQDIRIDRLLDSHIPFVTIGNPLKSSLKIPCVDNDNQKILQDVTQCLIDLGHKNIAFLNSQANLTITYDRFIGYLNAHQLNNLMVDTNLVTNTDSSYEENEEAIEKIFSHEKKITAIIAQSTIVAKNIYEILTKKGFSIPDDISLISLGGEPHKLFKNQYPTYVDVDFNAVGHLAVDLLIKHINKETDNLKTIIDYKIIHGDLCQENKNRT